jgi:hypothetical protein
MSAATDLIPVVHIPERARRPESRSATVLALHAPSVASVAQPVRLTRRGLIVAAVAVAVAAGALLWGAWLSAPGGAASSSARPVPAAVQVRSGDTLWSIAGQVAPGRDPRLEVAILQRLNHLGGASLAVGQVLRTR